MNGDKTLFDLTLTRLLWLGFAGPRLPLCVRPHAWPWTGYVLTIPSASGLGRKFSIAFPQLFMLFESLPSASSFQACVAQSSLHSGPYPRGPDSSTCLRSGLRGHRVIWGLPVDPSMVSPPRISFIFLEKRYTRCQWTEKSQNPLHR